MYIYIIVINFYFLENNKFFKWSDGNTKFLLSKYLEYGDSVGPLKVFRTKKLMWQKLADDISKEFNITVNGLQVETRYRCVMKRTKKIIDNNNKSGAVRLETAYDDEVQNIIQADDSLFPDFALSPHNQADKTTLFSEKSSVSASQSLTTLDRDRPSTSTSTPRSTPVSYDEDSASMDPFTKRKRTKSNTQELLMQQFMEQRNEHFEKRKELYEEKVKSAAS